MKVISGYLEDLLAEQVAFYDAHASEYEDALYRRGRWDYGDEENKKWLQEFNDVKKTVETIILNRSIGRALDVACGTGYWSRVLSLAGYNVHGIDSSPRMLNRAMEVCQNMNVTFELADAFNYKTISKYDLILLGCWISHIPRSLLSEFMSNINRLLEENGTIIIIDHLPFAGTFAKDSLLTEDPSEVVERVAPSGDKFKIAKVFWKENDLKDIFRKNNLSLQCEYSGFSFFVYSALHL